MTHERGVGGRRDSTGGKIRDGELPCPGDLADQIQGGGQFLRHVHQLIAAERCKTAHLTGNGSHVTNGFDDIARSGFALGADHRRAFSDATQRFT